MNIASWRAAFEQLLDHWLLVLVLVYGGYKLVQMVRNGIAGFKAFIGEEIEVRLPRILKAEFQNGLGTMLQGKLDGAFRDHEQREQEQVSSVIQQHVEAYHRGRRR